MNVPNVQSTPITPTTVPATTDKRAILQAALLRKSLDLQQNDISEIIKQQEGKGQLIDIRV